MPDSFTQEGLLHEFKDQFTNQSILIPCSKQARDKLAKELMKWDNQVQVLHLYEPVTNIENVRKVHELIQQQEVTHVTFQVHQLFLVILITIIEFRTQLKFMQLVL